MPAEMNLRIQLHVGGECVVHLLSFGGGWFEDLNVVVASPGVARFETVGDGLHEATAFFAADDAAVTGSPFFEALHFDRLIDEFAIDRGVDDPHVFGGLAEDVGFDGQHFAREDSGVFRGDVGDDGAGGHGDLSGRE